MWMDQSRKPELCLEQKQLENEGNIIEISSTECPKIVDTLSVDSLIRISDGDSELGSHV